MEFKLHRMSDYSDESLIAEIRRVAEVVPYGPLTKKIFDIHARTSSSTIHKRFGSWEEALQAAGLSSRYSGASVTNRMRLQLGKSVTRKQVIEELQSAASRLGRSDLTVEDFNTYSTFNASTVRSYFKTWRAALEAAGLNVRAKAIRYTDEECFENLLNVWTHFGRPPRYREMNAKPSAVGGKAYVGRWGTWIKALEAFVERVNTDTEKESQPYHSASEETTTFSSPQSVSEKDDGRIRLGLRYRTLVRDNFKCALCGRSPATDPLCQLHVDHFIPVSKGGLTTLENLRTLCEYCNLGKSNLTIEIAHVASG